LTAQTVERLLKEDLFLHRFVARHVPSISDSDLRLRLLMYTEGRDSITDWHEDVLAQEQIKVDWREAQPVVELSGVGPWLALSNEFDADGLLTFDLARRRVLSAPSMHGDLYNWRTIVRCSDFDLGKLLARGVSDLHIHVGGVRLQQSIWLRVMDDAEAFRRYPQLNRAYGQDERRSWTDNNGDYGSFAEDMRRARELRGVLLRSAGLQGIGPEHPVNSGESWWSWSYTALNWERLLLIAAWSQVLHLSDARIGDVLDEYLGLKHRFARIGKQPIFDAPVGLKYFSERYFRRLEPREARAPRIKKKAAHRESHRFTMESTANACAFVLESPSLEKVELRIAPFERAPDYWRYFRLWARFKRDQLDPWLKKMGRERVQVGFAVHFKRSAPPFRPGQPLAAKTGFYRRLVDLDRSTSELRIALACPRRGAALNDLRRVDVAGNERDAHAALFGFHLRLLRSDPDAVRRLDQLMANVSFESPLTPFIGRWARVARRGQARSSPAETQLGLTMHAGEDYADQLEGLYQIAGAIDCCGMRAGDAIGHALALAPEAERPTRPNTASIEAGASLASLCWLHETVGGEIDGALGATFVELREMIAGLARTIYDPTGPLPNVDEVVAGWRIGFHMTEDQHLRPHFAGGWALFKQFFSQQVAARAERNIDAESRRRLAPLTEVARRRLCQQIIARRIVVEMNPSSNIRISGSEDARSLPTIKILQMINDGLVACINTDNPGVFATCIENEYAVLMDSGRDARMGERDLRDLLERARRAGLENVYWR